MILRVGPVILGTLPPFLRMRRWDTTAPTGDPRILPPDHGVICRSATRGSQQYSTHALAGGLVGPFPVGSCPDTTSPPTARPTPPPPPGFAFVSHEGRGRPHRLHRRAAPLQGRIHPPEDQRKNATQGPCGAEPMGPDFVRPQ